MLNQDDATVADVVPVASCGAADCVASSELAT